MGELTRIDNKEVEDFYHEIYGTQSKLTEAENKREELEKKVIREDVILAEDETTIYEYDYECIKKSGLLDRIYKAAKANK